MNKGHQRKIELRITRSTSTLDSKVLKYLSNHPSGKTASELAMEAINSYWLEETVLEQVSDEYFHRACYIAAQNLKARLNLIEKRIGVTFTISPLIDRNESTKGCSAREITDIAEVKEDNSKIEDEDWGDEELKSYKMETSEEIIAVNKLLGLN